MSDWMPSLVDGVWIPSPKKKLLPFKNRLVSLQLTEVGRRYLDGNVKWSSVAERGEVPKHWSKEQP